MPRKGQLHFYVRTPLERLQCAHCHQAEVTRRGAKERTFFSVPIGDMKTRIVYLVQRLECQSCAALAQEHLRFAEPYKRYTRQFKRYVLNRCNQMTTSALAKQLEVSWDLVRKIEQDYLEREVSKRQLKDLRKLAVDELAIGKGHTYVSVVLNLESGAIVYVGDGKGADAVEPFFRRLRHSQAFIETIAMDMSGAYQLAARRQLPKAEIVFDHFHVIKLMNDKLSTLRRQVQNHAHALAKETIKGTRWLLLKAPENLKADKQEPARLEAALELNEPLAKAYYLKEDLRQFWQQPDEAHAKAFLGQWIATALATGIQVLKQMARTLIKHREGLLNYFRHPVSTGPLEGLNNKAQTMKRQAYGYRNRHFYKLKLMTLHKKKYALVG